MASPDAILLQLGYALLVVAVLAPRLGSVRLFVALAALAGLLRALLWTGDVVGAAWMGLLLVTCLLLLARTLYERRKASFTAEERRMIDSLVAGLSQTRARHLIDQGMWLTGKAGDRLTREGEPVEHLYYLAEGDARVLMEGRQIATCHAGDLIGELTVLSGDKATATVILDGPARFWCAPAENLRPYVEAHDDIRRAIEHGFAKALKSKLHASNAAMVQAGGVAPAA
jgi:CRP-like cAMP-binding protein